MNLRLVLESVPHHTQSQQERVFQGGTLVIGRGDEADWQLNDPDMYVSRRHCIISDESGVPMVTDASSGGLFIDNAANPVGVGNAVPIDVGMRLRVGDFVIRVEAFADTDTGAASVPNPAPKPDAFGFGFEFAEPPEQKEDRARPETLPDPFDPRAGSRGRDPFGLNDDPEEHTLKPVDWENPMGLDLRKGGPVTEPGRTLGPSSLSDGAEVRTGLSGASKYFDGVSQPDYDPAPDHSYKIPDEPPIVAQARDVSSDAPEMREQKQERTAHMAAQNTAPACTTGDSALREALLRGMGLDPARIPVDDSEAEMEQLGARFRELVEGLMMLLRSRAEEKGRARVAQTIIANEDVNPLKFLATPEDAMAALLQPRAKGYLPPDQAVTWAFRDLADHQLRTWGALQAALRRMIDRFDPAQIESEAQELGILEKLIAGGKSAKMWDMYEEHYRDLAQSAEEQFLGEVGADFREAYETKRSK